MDLTIRKYKFIEKFMQIINEDKIALFEKLLQKEVSDKDIVAYTVQGEPLSKEKYIKLVQEADASVSAGNYTAIEDLEKEVQGW